MSIKKLTFLPDFSSLSRWGSERRPFFALVDFDGRLLAAPLATADFSLISGAFCGGIDLSGELLRFRFNITQHHATLGLNELSKGLNQQQSEKSPQRLLITERPNHAEALATIARLQVQEQRGLSYLINYCSQTVVRVNAPFGQIFERSSAPYTFWFDQRFLCFSPEAFIHVRGNQITTAPMKGTGRDSKALIEDVKEQAEHATVVDLLRNDLGQVARQIRIDGYRELSVILQSDGGVLYQTSSRISGVMPANWREALGDWLPKLLPAGSITGAPKPETVELIRRYESEPRGFFTGIAILFDGENLYSAVLIRFLDIQSEVFKFRSGAGVTIYSDPETEYNEIVSKVYLPI